MYFQSMIYIKKGKKTIVHCYEVTQGGAYWIHGCVFAHFFPSWNKSLICSVHRVPTGLKDLWDETFTFWTIFFYRTFSRIRISQPKRMILFPVWLLLCCIKIAPTRYIIMRYPRVVLLPLRAKLGKTLSLSVQTLDIKGLQLDIGPCLEVLARLCGLTVSSCGQWCCNMTFTEGRDRDSLITVPCLIFLPCRSLFSSFPVSLWSFEWWHSDKERVWVEYPRVMSLGPCR